ncbi:MAG: hypothetical protein NTU62_08640, partial [Spirochaetes bacterium]|nr:hypothetical protein [Spirochaetota bacterium]
MDITSIIVPAIFIGGILLMLPIAYRVLRRHNDRMRRMADELGFTFHGAGDEPPGAAEPTGVRRFLQIFKPWRMTGMHDGVAVAIYLESRGTSRNRTSYSIVEASFPRPLPFTLLVGRETAMARLGKAVFGIQDIQVGSEQFDAAVRVKGSEPDRI